MCRALISLIILLFMCPNGFSQIEPAEHELDNYVRSKPSADLHLSINDLNITTIVAKSNENFCGALMNPYPVPNEHALRSALSSLQPLRSEQERLIRLTQKLMKDSLKISDPPCNATILLLKSRAMNIFVLQEYLKGKLAQKEIDDTGKAIWDSLRPTVDLVDADTKLSLFGSLADLTIAGVAYSYGNARSATAVLRSGLVIEQFYWQAFPQYYGTESDYIRTEVVISGFVTLLEKEEISGVDIISEQIDQYTEIVRKLMSR